ncbi:MAG: 5'/3'-nucleotidase SurE [Clostridiales bacterium]|nr:5'/3'-nucleotidase SurE [Clostridiales bacterium]
MNILLTNDDGISSKGIKALTDACLRRGHRVLMSAPVSQCSANSQHITLTSPIVTKCMENTEQILSYAVYGTPADCIRISKELFAGEKIDFCISGINDGENVGSGIYYSGTVCAAREAAMMYIPSLAVSIARGADEIQLDAAAEKAVGMAEKLIHTDFPRMGVVNINFPAVDPDTWPQMRLCPLSYAFYVDKYITCHNPHGEKYFWLGKGENIEEPQEGSDLYLLRKGIPTCSFISQYICNNDLLEGKMQDILQKT